MSKSSSVFSKKVVEMKNSMGLVQKLGSNPDQI